jgi:ribosomal protein S18 acetylase RimI-like enzyme
MADEALRIRPATEADEDAVRSLWEEFEADFVWDVEDPETWAEEWADVLEDLRTGGVFLAEDDDEPLGVARIEATRRGRAHVQLVHVRSHARHRGIAKALLAECVSVAQAQGARNITLDVLATNAEALVVWRRLGFRETAHLLAMPIDALAGRLTDGPSGERRGSTHVQSDDEVSVGRAIAQFVPRLEQADVRASDSWIRVADPALDRDHEAHGRFAKELSDRLGAVTVALGLEGEVVRFRLFERGRMVDEYLSVPSYYGVLPTADELALAVNPTLVARLTGADREEVRRVARTAATPADLPPAAELYKELAALMGLEP